MTVFRESCLVGASALFVAYVSLGLLLQNIQCICKSASKRTPSPTVESVADDASDDSWGATSETLVGSTESSPVARTPQTATLPLPQTPVARPAIPVPMAPPRAPPMLIPHDHLIGILSRSDFLEEDNFHAHQELQRLGHAEQQWRGTLHAMSTQIEQLTREREHASAEHARWRVFAAERAQDEACLSAHALHLEERVAGLEADVLFFRGMKETLADMTVAVQHRCHGIKTRLECRVAELEGKMAELERENELLWEEMESLRGGPGARTEAAGELSQPHVGGDGWHNVQLQYGSRAPC